MDQSVIEEALEISNEVIWVMRCGTAAECCNYTGPCNREKYGIREQKSQTNFWLQNIHPDDYDQVVSEFQSTFLNISASNLTQEYRLLGPDNTIFFIKNKMRFTRRSDGEPEKVTGLWSDITDSKKDIRLLQDEFHQVNQQLLSGLQEYSEREIVLNQSQQLARIGSWEYDLESKTMTWSDEMYNIFNVDRRSFPINDLEKIPQLFATEYVNQIQGFLQDNIIEKLPFDINARLNSTAEKSSTWVRITAAPVKNNRVLKRVSGLVYDVTFFKEAEENLKRSEEKFSKAFDLNPGLMLIVRECDQVIIEANSKILEVTGYSAREVIGKTFQDINVWIHVVEQESYLDSLRKYKVVSLEATLRRKNGEAFFGNISVQGILFAGEIHHLVVVNDITDKKLAEDKIKLSEARLNAIINNTDLQVWSVDTSYRIEAMNNVFRESAKEIFGVALGVGMSALDVSENKTTTETPAIIKDIYDRAFSGEIVSWESSTNDKYFYSCVHPIISNGRVVGASAYSRDITEQKQAEEKIRLNEANLAAMINNTSLFIWSVDRESRMITFNKQIEDLVKEKFGVSLKVGSWPLAESDSPNPVKIIEEWTERYNRALMGEIVKGTSDAFGRIFNYSLSPIIEEKKVTGVSVFAEDVTENVRKDKELSEANAKIGEYKLVALRSVMNPHFIFNALNSIQSFIMVNDQVNAMNYLSTFSKLMRSILNNSVQNRIRLSEELEQLKHYICLEQLRFQNSFDFVLDIGPNLEPEEIEIPSLLLQPYIENAILHGLYNKSGRGTLKLFIRDLGRSVLFEIEDDGVGREEAMRLRQRSLPKHKSMGTSLTEERLKLINSDGKLLLETIDLVENGKALGTRIKIQVNSDNSLNTTLC